MIYIVYYIYASNVQVNSKSLMINIMMAPFQPWPFYLLISKFIGFFYTSWIGGQINELWVDYRGADRGSLSPDPLTQGCCLLIILKINLQKPQMMGLLTFISIKNFLVWCLRQRELSLCLWVCMYMHNKRFAI